jgi:uncharacterized protein (TIGR02452 family)
VSARLRGIAQETVGIIRAGGYDTAAGGRVGIACAVEEAIAGTRHYLPDAELRVPAGPAGGSPAIEVTGESTLAAARRLGPKAVCLVFASAHNPGGGFLTGAQAQEESVARASALYASLSTVPEFYAFHRADRDLRYSDRVIYSPGVPVFRDDHDRLIDDAYRTSFLTCAAPNLGAMLVNGSPHAADVPHVLRRRARRVLAVAAAHGHRTLVLGAWGCGVFRNVPATVADAFAEALGAVDHFDRVVFAILDGLRGTPVRAAFEARFAAA